MFNIENVKIGTYIEFRDGNYGYIKELDFSNYKCVIFITNKREYFNISAKCFTNYECLSNTFKQIGTYIFKDKDNIEPLIPKAVYKEVKCKKVEIKAKDYPSDICINSIPYSYESILDHIEYDNMSMGVKINEIIKWINEKGMGNKDEE